MTIPRSNLPAKLLASLAAVFFLLIGTHHAQAIAPCDFGSNRDFVTCVVDGDTIWVDGINYRLAGFDAPEGYRNLCGGERERRLANQATSRVVQLMNDNPWRVQPLGRADRYGRVLASLLINGRDVGDILVAERLARVWPDGDEWWCR